MSYMANYDTALTYFRAGLTDRAVESLSKALKDVPEGEKRKDNRTYLHILTLLSRIQLERGNRPEAIQYIDEGLNIHSMHTDLLFLKSLYCWDEKLYDEMSGAIITYLVSLTSPDLSQYGYEFSGEGALNEIFTKLIPASYRKAIVHKEILAIVRQLSEKTGSELMQQAYVIMQKIDSEREN